MVWLFNNIGNCDLDRKNNSVRGYTSIISDGNIAKREQELPDKQTTKRLKPEFGYFDHALGLAKTVSL